MCICVCKWTVDAGDAHLLQLVFDFTQRSNRVLVDAVDLGAQMGGDGGGDGGGGITEQGVGVTECARTCL